MQLTKSAQKSWGCGRFTVLTVILAISCLGVVPSAKGETFTLTRAPQSYSDWSSGDSYEGRSAPPGDGSSIVLLPANTTSVVDNASVAYVGALGIIRPQGAAAIVVNVTTDTVFNSAFTPSEKTRPAERGLFIKRGSGFLTLSSLGKLPRYNGANLVSNHQFDYDTNFRVEEGTLKMPDVGTGANSATISGFFYRDVTVLAGAVFAPSASANSTKAENWLNAIWGEGSISNGVGNASKCEFRPTYSGQTPCVFAGSVDGKMKFYSSAHLWLTGSNSTLGSEGFLCSENRDSLTTGILGVKKIGLNSTTPSSLGMYTYVSLADYGSRLLYLGEGEQTAKQFYLYDTGHAGTKYPSVFDAGAVGGVEFTGKWIQNVGAGYLHRLHLDGSNTTACVMNGSAEAGTGSGKSLYVVKKGTGEWRFIGNSKDRSAFAGFAVENGTLGFDSLAERGSNCALGPCNHFYKDAWGSTGSLAEESYCFLLGAESSCGTMAYEGEDPMFCSTRPIALKGDGCLRNAGNARTVFQSGVTALDATSTKHLVLDGGGSGENVVTDVTDGDGTVKVVKKGAGTWTLSGTNNAFTGGIEVQNGKLILQGVAGKFNWWRLTIRKMWGNVSICELTEFGLYDKNGMRINGGLSRNSELAVSGVSTFTPSTLRRVVPGTAAFGREFGSCTRTLEDLFDDAESTGGGLSIQTKLQGSDSYNYPAEDNPNTWIPIVMHIGAGTAEVESYDLALCIQQSYFYQPRSWLLEGSVDGETWWTVDDVSVASNPARERTQSEGHSAWWWNADTTCTIGTTGTHSGGRPINGSTNALAVVYSCPVSVVSNATLEADGLVKLSSLRVDPESGGTLRGFSFADNGVLSVTKKPTGSDATLPLTVEAAQGLANVAHWTVEVAGATRDWKAAVTTDGRITIYRPGIRVIFR